MNQKLENLREELLKSELEDFQKLLKETESTLKLLSLTGEVIMNRYCLEDRNSFDTKTKNNYEKFLESSIQLKNYLDKNQKSFYQKRILEIQEELKEIINNKQ